MMRDTDFDMLDRGRQARNYRTIAQTIALADQGNVILDPFSTLIATNAVIGTGNVFYPNTTFTADTPGTVCIGNGNVFYPGTAITATTGKISIGNDNLFGEGSVCIATNRVGAEIIIGSQVRFRGFIDIGGTCHLGDGCQILGQISAVNVWLGAGGSFAHPIADERGAVLKGHGRAADIRLETGQVIAGDGRFTHADMRMQSYYHPEAT